MQQTNPTTRRIRGWTPPTSQGDENDETEAVMMNLCCVIFTSVVVLLQVNVSVEVVQNYRK